VAKLGEAVPAAVGEVLISATPSSEELVPSMAKLGEAVPAAVGATGGSVHEESPWELVQSRRSLRRTALATLAVKTRRSPQMGRFRKP
jgi:hypothetical protein